MLGQHASRGRTDSSERARCGYCRGGIPAGEGVDIDGAPLPDGASFEWVDGGPTPYHPECVQSGDGPWVPWTAHGVLADTDDRGR